MMSVLSDKGLMLIVTSLMTNKITLGGVWWGAC